LNILNIRAYLQSKIIDIIFGAVIALSFSFAVLFVSLFDLAFMYAGIDLLVAVSIVYMQIKIQAIFIGSGLVLDFLTIHGGNHCHHHFISPSRQDDQHEFG
jgi:hypothetical protein